MDNTPSLLADEMIDSNHRLLVGIYYAHTDFSGVVYHARYLKFFERGRIEHFRRFIARYKDFLTEIAGRWYGSSATWKCASGAEISRLGWSNIGGKSTCACTNIAGGTVTRGRPVTVTVVFERAQKHFVPECQIFLACLVLRSQSNS